MMDDELRERLGAWTTDIGQKALRWFMDAMVLDKNPAHTLDQIACMLVTFRNDFASELGDEVSVEMMDREMLSRMRVGEYDTILNLAAIGLDVVIRGCPATADCVDRPMPTAPKVVPPVVSGRLPLDVLTVDNAEVGMLIVHEKQDPRYTEILLRNALGWCYAGDVCMMQIPDDLLYHWRIVERPRSANPTTQQDEEEQQAD